jgi:hypothetical protein
VDDEIWVCQDGRRLAVGEMTEEHAKNTLRMILRNRRRRREAKVDLAFEHLPDFDEEDRKWGSD